MYIEQGAPTSLYSRLHALLSARGKGTDAQHPPLSAQTPALSVQRPVLGVQRAVISEATVLGAQRPAMCSQGLMFPGSRGVFLPPRPGEPVPGTSGPVFNSLQSIAVARELVSGSGPGTGLVSERPGSTSGPRRPALSSQGLVSGAHI
ncbi:unnamed protein product [Parnassius apollo]|uniref:(apollo) hypothetical protein n=1 Tax=Parnassius apollo TaxID=110799 RepID=A0A8S3X1I8_PARAO|nr:unnamed protein product [Parnassius apollo]